MPFKFEGLEVYQLALAVVDDVYALSEALPKGEDFNLKSQIRRAATSIALNIAEGSVGQTDQEQARFVGLALRSGMEVVACLDIIKRRAYLSEPRPIAGLYRQLEILTAKLHTFRQSLDPLRRWARETADQPYGSSTDDNPK